LDPFLFVVENASLPFWAGVVRLLVQRYKNGRFLCSSGIKKSHNLPLPDRQVRLPLPQIAGKIYIKNMAYAIMGKYPPGGQYIVCASPRREPLQKILDDSPELGSIEEKDFGFDISGIDKFYSVNLRFTIPPEYEQYPCDGGEYYLDYETAAKHETTPEELTAPDTPPIVYGVVTVKVVE
jgi:hypothetical protein